jgi:alpha-galactosidase
MLIDNRFEILEPLATMVRMERGESGFRIWLSSCDEPIKYVRVKWFFDTSFMKKVLADTWGVALADLEWVTLPLKHPAQWYFSAFDGEHTHGFGVKTSCNSFCSWEIAPDGITLTCDVRNGGEGVRLREELLVAETVYYQSEAGETPYRACQSFCRAMSHKSSYPDRPIYGFNTWYYTYGNITRASVLEDARLCARLASKNEAGAPRPFMVIDDGWNKNGTPEYNGGPFVPNDDFADMREVARQIREIGCEPGIWVRPLLVLPELCPEIDEDSYSMQPDGPQHGRFLDPTTPGAQNYIRKLIRGLAADGYRLIKHDFTCPDLMGPDFLKPNLTRPGWHWHDESKTNAQVCKELYTLIQEAANGAYIIGCNIYNHLAVGIHDIVRSGCDTSGHHWEITRDYGINTLAFRSYQNKAFFMTDADCAAFTDRVPTELNLQFSELLSMSDSAFFISAAPGILNEQDEQRLMQMFCRITRRGSDLEPVDWLDRRVPEQFIGDGQLRRYTWDE